MSIILEKLREPWSEYQTTEVKYENRTMISVDPYYLRERIIHLTGAPVDLKILSSDLKEGLNGHKTFVVGGYLTIAGMRSSDEIGACDIDIDGNQEDAYKSAVTNCFVRCCKSFGMDVEPIFDAVDRPAKKASESSVKSPKKSIDAALNIATSPENTQDEGLEEGGNNLYQQKGEEKEQEAEAETKTDAPDFSLTPKEQDVYTDLIDKYGKSVFDGFSKGYNAEIAYLIQDKLHKDDYEVLCKKHEIDLEKYKQEKSWDRLSAKRCYEHYCMSNGMTLKKSQADIDLYLERVAQKSEAMKGLEIESHEDKINESKDKEAKSLEDVSREVEPEKTIDEVEEELPRSDQDLVELWDEVEEATSKFEEDFKDSKVIASYEQFSTFRETFQNFLRTAPRADVDRFIKEMK